MGEAGTCISLAEAGTLHLEFVYLSAITGNPVYAKKVNRVRSLLANSRLQNGLYPNSVDFNDPKGAPCSLGFSVSIGGNADSFYEYLFKAYLLSDKQDRVAEELFVQAAHSLEGNLLYTSSAGLEFFAMLTASGHLEYRVEHLACFIGGLYALYSQYAREDDKTRLVQLAQNLTATCRSSYANTGKGFVRYSGKGQGLVCVLFCSYKTWTGVFRLRYGRTTNAGVQYSFLYSST